MNYPSSRKEDLSRCEGTESGLWDQFWFRQKIDPTLVTRKATSSVFKLLESIVKQHYGTIQGRRVVELGSGQGTNALLLGLQGASVTLVDRSDAALKSAERLYDHFGVKARMIREDVFAFSRGILSGEYDVSMSFGLVEHFNGIRRKEAIAAHVDVVREGGLSVVSVPNRLCFPYRFWMEALRVIGKWDVGFEKPFGRKELILLCRELSISDYEIVGANFLKSISDHGLSFLTYPIQKAFSRNPNPVPLQLLPDFRIPPLDNRLGYALWLVIRK